MRWSASRTRNGMRHKWFASIAVAATVLLAGCSFDGPNSLPVPGAEGTGWGLLRDHGGDPDGGRAGQQRTHPDG